MVPALRSLQGVSGPSCEDSRSIISPPFLPSLPVSLSLSLWCPETATLAQHNVTRHYLELRSRGKTEETGGEGTSRGQLSFLSWKQSRVSCLGVGRGGLSLVLPPVLYLHSPRCHFYCHSICKETDCGTFWEKKWFKMNEMGQRDIQLTEEGPMFALPSLMLLIICH